MISRRAWLKQMGAAGAGAMMPLSQPITATQQPPGDGAILSLTSTSGVMTPTRGRSFQKFSFDFPEPSIVFEGLQFGFRVFTDENVYALDPNAIGAAKSGESLLVTCDGFSWAGGQQKVGAGVRLTARLSTFADLIECAVAVTEFDKPIKAVATIVRGIPRGRISGGGAPFFDPRDDEILFGYPFSGGDLFGPQGNAGLTTPLVLIQPRDGEVVALSSADDRVRTKRFYFQPGPDGYRVEMLVEAEGWARTTHFQAPAWRIRRASSVAAAAGPHFDHLERVFHLPRWQTRADVPAWLRETALVVSLHGQHYTGYIFNDYAKMRTTLDWVATKIDPRRVLVFLAAWDGRYYWDYPKYEPDARMGGASGFRALVKSAQAHGFRVMPMFGMNAANRRQPSFAGFVDAATSRIDGDRLELNWVDWDNDRHQEGWLSYMNLGVDSWRTHLVDRIAAIVSDYGVDAYFLDIAGGWVNNPRADMHDGTRRLVAELRQRFPSIVACGEMHYDALMEFIPLYQSFGQTLVAGEVQRHAKFFQHLSHPAPGRGSSGVHESGFGRWNPDTLSLTDTTIPTLTVVDDTVDRYRAEMTAVIDRAKSRAGI
jgi:hypothetical protein